MARILVVDDESLIRILVADVGESLGHEVLTAASIKEGQDLAQRGVDIVLLDVLLPDGDGLAHVETFSQLPGRPDVIIITGHGNADAAEAALRSGAWEYLVKPLRVRDLSKALTQAVQWRNSRDSQSRSLLRHPDIIGKSPALAEALEALREAAASNVNVLITGETGTGKELFASALHANSLRASGPFVTVDCTTLPETLVEAHLFGHARGAFTGADRAREGLLAAADHGTLFLDEVGELPLPVQGAFLRALELRRFRPVGEVREVESDFRLVAATNRDLDDMVGMDLYRSDLRFRLRGMTIHVPPLRRRAEDIPLLAEHFTARYCQRHELPNKELTPDCYAMLADYSWPGNVRELRHTIERACAAAGGRNPAVYPAPAHGNPHRTGPQTACAPLRARGIRADRPSPGTRTLHAAPEARNLPHPARHEGQSRTRLHRRAVRRLSGRRPPRRRDCRRFTRAFL